MKKQNSVKKSIVAILMTFVLLFASPITVFASAGVTLRDDGIKFVDLDMIIADGGDLSDVPSDEDNTIEEIDEEEDIPKEEILPKEIIAKEPEEPPKPEDVIHIILVRCKEIYLNEEPCDSIDAFCENFEDVYEEGNQIELHDLYSEYHVLRDMLKYLDDNGYAYTLNIEDEY